MLRPNGGQKEPVCYGQELARKSHQDSAVGFVTAKRGPERASKTRQYDLLWPNVGLKEPPRLGSTICYGQELARKSHQDSAVRFVTAKTCHQDSAVRFVTARPEKATKTRLYDLLWRNVDQNEPPRLGSTICYGQTWARRSHQDSAVRFVTAKSGPERATETRQVRFVVGLKEPPRLGSTIWPNVGQKEHHQDSAIRFVYGQDLPSTTGPERATLRPRVDQPPRQYDHVTAKSWPERATKLAVICCGQTCGPVRFVEPSRARLGNTFVTAKSWQERATRQYDL